MNVGLIRIYLVNLVNLALATVGHECLLTNLRPLLI